jgi:hypothetical protein
MKMIAIPEIRSPLKKISIGPKRIVTKIEIMSSSSRPHGFNFISPNVGIAYNSKDKNEVANALSSWEAIASYIPKILPIVVNVRKIIINNSLLVRL